MILQMKGNYTGKKIVFFQIFPADIAGDTFEAEHLSVTYTGRKQTPTPKLIWNGMALKYGADFFVSEYDRAKNDKNAFKEPKEYELTLTGKKNFIGTRLITLTVSGSVKQIAMGQVAIRGIKNMPWTGEQITQTGFSVKYGNTLLSEANGDYTLQWGVNTDVGTGTAVFTGTGEDRDGDGVSFIGTKKVFFKITGTAMNKVTVLGVEKNYAYTGLEIKPVAKLVYQAGKNATEVQLSEGVHYSVTYQKNVDKGTASILFTGLPGGGYTGTKTVSFDIVSRAIDNASGMGNGLQIEFADSGRIKDGIYTALYMKGGARPEVIVTVGDRTLEMGRDYQVSYANNRKVALSTDVKAPTVTVTGKGNYKGKKSVTFSIIAKPLTNENGITVVVKDKTVSTKASGFRQSFKVYDADGKSLGGGDYDVKNVVYTLIGTAGEDGSASAGNQILDKNSVVPADSVIRITVKGKGVYAGGEASGTYRILKKDCDIGKAVIRINNQPFTGQPVWIVDQEQFVPDKVYLKIGGTKKTLILGEDIEVVPDSYVKNVNKGTAKVTFRGINGFGGTKTVSFRIGVRSILDFWRGIFGSL